ncbi:MAG: endonuclease/exonuclease/phosphatase family protein [Pirellulales bacterium]|nr:endonuclease/exonuclease/phosphatase family protein [Pirellulales bacterium]
MHFRLLTYNIHKGIGGVDRRYDLGRIIETIAHYAPDVALLQEVDDGVPRSRRERQVDLLAAATGLTHVAYQHNVRLRLGHYGNAILSRAPLHEVADCDLTVPLKKRRQALLARCEFHFQGHRRTVAVACVHLGLAGYERQIQLRRLLAQPFFTHLHAATPAIVGGDYNDVWNSLGRKALRDHGFAAAGKRVRTFPAIMPARPLDRVYYRGDLEAIAAYAGHTQTARLASDHRPLVVDFRLKGT